MPLLRFMAAESELRINLEESNKHYQTQHLTVSNLKARVEISRDTIAKADECMHQSGLGHQSHGRLESLHKIVLQTDGGMAYQNGGEPSTLVAKKHASTSGGDGHLLCEHCLQEIQPDQFMNKLTIMKVGFSSNMLAMVHFDIYHAGLKICHPQIQENLVLLEAQCQEAENVLKQLDVSRQEAVRLLQELQADHQEEVIQWTRHLL